METKNEKNEASNSLESSKKSITEDSFEKSKNVQDKDKSDTKSIKTTTEEEQNMEEIIDLPSPENPRYEFFSKEQWEQEIELYRAYILDLSGPNSPGPDIYRLTSEIAIIGTLTFRLYKKEIKNYYFEAKFPFEDAFKLFGYIPFKKYHSLVSLYTQVVEFLIQNMKFKLKEPITENSEKATIEFINGKITPNRKCFFELRKIIVKEKKIDELVKHYLADIDRKLYSLKLQNRIFFEMNNGPQKNTNYYNYFKEPEEIKRETEMMIRKQKEYENQRKMKEELERNKTPLQKLNDKLKTNININDKKITIQKEHFNNDFFKLLSKNKFTNLEVLELNCNFITDLKGLTEPGFKNLKVIYLHTKIKDISFLENVEFENLEDLSLIENNFSSVESIAKAPFVKNLKKLDLYKNGIKSISGFNKGHFDKLTKLVLSKNNIKELEGINKDTFKVLVDLELEENELQDIEGLENFNQYYFENVKYLDLNWNQIKNGDILSKFNFNKLIRLNLNNNKILDIQFLEQLKAKNLEELLLNHNFIQIFEPLTKSPFPELKILQITDNQNVTNFDFLNKLPFNKLEKLICCGYSELSDINFLKKKNYENLKYLSLTRNQIVDIEPLKDCKFKGLKYLSMEENSIKSINVFSSVCFKDLEELYMDRNKIDSIQVLEKVPFVNIKRINFSQNCFVKITVLGNLKFNKIQCIDLQRGSVYTRDEDNIIAKERFKNRYTDCSLYL